MTRPAAVLNEFRPMCSAMTAFRNSPVGELLLGTAHDSHPGDITTPLGVRFAGRTILALHVALEKAATVRVSFSSAGEPTVGGIHHIRQRSSAELVTVLRTEAAASRAEWVVVVLATGWQAVVGQRAARAEATERSNLFARHRLMFETPEVVHPRAQVDRVYTAVDHPVLDKSIVFSARRSEIEELFAAIHQCNLGVAAVRIAVAAQLEIWLAREGEAGLGRDLLISDGLSALLLNVEQGDFVLPRAAIEAEQPRQSVQRPSTVEEDAARFIGANGGRSIMYVGPDDLCLGIKKRVGDAEIIRLPDHPAHETQRVALAAGVQHDLNFEAREVRPALPRRWRRILWAYAAVVLLLLGVVAVNMAYAIRVGYESYQIERTARRQADNANAESAASIRMAADFAEANALRNWVAANYHAQRLTYRLLRDVPATAALDRLVVELTGGQMTLTFVVLGDAETQLRTHRALERAINELKYKIAGEDPATMTVGGNRSVQYRVHMILPDAGEVSL